MSKLNILKILSSVSGFFLIFFLILHVAGNLKYFAGPTKLDDYAALLRTFGKELFGEYTLLNSFRVLLLIAFLTHVGSTLILWKYNSNAASRYEGDVTYRSTTFASRYMFLLGIFALFFIIFHLLHFTFGLIHPEGFEHLKVYNNVTISFKKFPYVLAYLIGVTAISVHISHGLWSSIQSLGFPYTVVIKARAISKLFAIFIWLGFLSVPFYIFFFK